VSQLSPAHDETLSGLRLFRIQHRGRLEKRLGNETPG
jgi:ribosomal protein L30/L7E